jgi:hypothetical protein
LNRILLDLAKKDLDEGCLKIDLTDYNRVIVQHRGYFDRKKPQEHSRTKI